MLLQVEQIRTEQLINIPVWSAIDTKKFKIGKMKQQLVK